MVFLSFSVLTMPSLVPLLFLPGLAIFHRRFYRPCHGASRLQRRRKGLKQKCLLQNERSHLVDSFYYAWNCTEMRGRQPLRHSVPRTNRFPTDCRKKLLRLK